MTIPNLTLAELQAIAVTYADPTNDCDACGDQMPGVLAPCLPDGDDAHPFVERCDSCGQGDDEAAARALAERAGLSVRRRYDSDELLHWRPFLARPGSADDRDTYCKGASEFGTFPDAEHPLSERVNDGPGSSYFDRVTRKRALTSDDQDLLRELLGPQQT